MQVRPLDEIADDVKRVSLAADLVHAHDVRMVELRGSPGLAEEHFRLGGFELVLPRDLDGHNPVELRVAGLPNRAELADADAFEQLELAKRLALGVVDRFGVAIDQAEAAPAGGANHLGGQVVIDQLNRLMAMRAANAHRNVALTRDHMPVSYLGGVRSVYWSHVAIAT